MGTIFIEGLSIPARIGVYKSEHGRLQELRLDIEVTSTKVERAAASEQLDDTIDYEALANAARKVVERRHYPLVETLASEIAKEVLTVPGVLTARVRLRKLHCFPGVSSAGTEVFIDGREERHPEPISASQLPAHAPIAVVGGGVAGLSAALWCWRLGHPALLVDPGPRLGGQLHMVHFRMFDVPALKPTTGPELAEMLWTQLPGPTRWLQGHLEHATIDADAVQLTLSLPDGAIHRLQASCAILSMGLRRRTLGVDGEDRLKDKGVLETASRGLGRLDGENAVVVGGGDAACENALKLAQAGAAVQLVHRREELSARAEFRRRVLRHPAVELVLGRRVTRFIGGSKLEEVELDDGRLLAAATALVRVGWLPNSGALPQSWTDGAGYLRCDHTLALHEQGRIFAAGDIRSPAALSVATGMGDGACAAKAAVRRLEIE